MRIFKRKKVQRPAVKSFFALGTVNSISIFHNRCEDVLEAAMKRVYDIERKMSVFREDSEVFRINENAGSGMPVRVSEDTFFVIKRALDYAVLSDRRLDITVMPLVELWRSAGRDKRVPDAGLISEALKLVDSDSVKMNQKERSVFLGKSGQGIDLGSIAKGYAADEVKKVLLGRGIDEAIINLGGNIIIMGGEKRVGIQDPDAEQGVSAGVLTLKNQTIVTSGDYERFYIIDNKRFHHIIDPTTGYPSAGGLRSVTIITEKSIDADALATCVFLLGAVKGLDRLPDGAQAVLVTEEGNIFITKGLIGNFELLNDKYVVREV